MKTLLYRFLITLALFASLHRANATTVFPIATNTSIVELVKGGTASSGSNYLVGLNQNSTNVCVQLVSTNGALIGSLMTVGASKGEPRVAFGKTNYLAFWGNDYISGAIDLYGQLISSSGVKVGSAFPLLQSLGTHGFQAEQAIAYDGTNFLVVWEDNNAATNKFYGQLVTTAGTLSGAEFLIGSAATGGAYNPQNDSATFLAFGATNYLFVWQIKVSDSPETWSTYGCFISRSGAVNGPIQISQTNSPSYNPLTIAFDGTNYLVVWNRDIGLGYPNPTIWNIDARFVAPGGTFPGNEFTLVTNQAIYPSLAFDGVNYLFAWAWNSHSNLFYEFLNRSANAVGPAFTVFQLQPTNAFGFGSVTFDGNRFGAVANLGSVTVDTNGNVTGIGSSAVYGAFIPSSKALPKLSSTSFTNRQFSLTLAGTPGINYAIQMATNLTPVNWTAIATNSPTNGAFTFTDTSATNKNRFYRALSQ